MDLKDIKVDSREGISMLMTWAKANGIYLNQAHIDIAQRHGVSVEGVLVAGHIPAVTDGSIYKRVIGPKRA